MNESFLEYVVKNKETIISLALILSEIFVIVVNTIKKIKSNTVTELSFNPPKKENIIIGVIKNLLWVANPINVFRKP